MRDVKFLTAFVQLTLDNMATSSKNIALAERSLNVPLLILPAKER